MQEGRRGKWMVRYLGLGAQGEVDGREKSSMSEEEDGSQAEEDGSQAESICPVEVGGWGGPGRAKTL